MLGTLFPIFAKSREYLAYFNSLYIFDKSQKMSTFAANFQGKKNISKFTA
jgi:hypothetical protein